MFHQIRVTPEDVIETAEMTANMSPDEKLDLLLEKVTGFYEKLDGINVKMNFFESTLNNHSESIGTINGSLTNTSTRIVNLEETTAAQKTIIDAV